MVTIIIIYTSRENSIRVIYKIKISGGNILEMDNSKALESFL